MSTIVIAGFGQAAIAFVKALRRLGGRQDVLVIGEEPICAYERPPLSKAVLTGQAPMAPAFFATPEDCQALGVEARLGETVVAIDRETRKVRLGDGGDVAYDILVLATGASPRCLAPPGASGPLPTLRSFSDARRLAGRLSQSRRLAVIGAGFLGLEIATAARRLGLAVTVLESSPGCMTRSVSPDISEWLLHLHGQAGVDVRLSTLVQHVEEGPDGLALHLDGQGAVEVDLAIAAIGAQPNDALAREAGILCADGVLVDEAGRSSDQAVLAIGDVARPRQLRERPGPRLESWDNAQRSAERAAAALLGLRSDPLPPWFWTDQQGRNLQMLGLQPATEAAAIVWRGGAGARPFARFALVEGCLVAAELVDLGRLRRPVERLIASGETVPPEVLADPTNHLRKLIG